MPLLVAAAVAGMTGIAGFLTGSALSDALGMGISLAAIAATAFAVFLLMRHMGVSI